MTTADSPAIQRLEGIAFVSMAMVMVVALWAVRAMIPLSIWLLLLLLLGGGIWVSWLRRRGAHFSLPPSIISMGLLLAVLIPAILVGTSTLVIHAAIMIALAGMIAIKSWAVRSRRDEGEWLSAGIILLVYACLVVIERPLEMWSVLGLGVLGWIGYAVFGGLVEWPRRATVLVSLHNELESAEPVLQRAAVICVVAAVLSVGVAGVMFKVQHKFPMILPQDAWQWFEKNMIDYYSHFSSTAIEDGEQLEKVSEEAQRLEEELKRVQAQMAGMDGEQTLAKLDDDGADRMAWIGPEEPSGGSTEETVEAAMEDVQELSLELTEVMDRLEAEQEVVVETPEPDQPVDESRKHRGLAWSSLLWLVLGVVLSGVSLWYWFAAKRSEEEEGVGGIRGEIMKLYRHMVRVASSAGQPKPASCTASEYLSMTGMAHPTIRESLESMTQTFLEAKYSAHQMTEEQARMAREACATLCAFWFDALPWWKRTWVKLVVSG